MKKVAVLGGSFDPIHKGHVELAKFILKQKKADEIWFMPAYIAPLKEHKQIDFTMRCKMIKAAIAPYRKMKLCTLEKKLPAPSYTINTVKALKKKYPDVQFYWVIGDDQAVKLDKWKSIDELKQLISFLCVKRENEMVNDPDLIYLEGFSFPASSTLVRQGEWAMVPYAVRKIMIKEGLYLDELLDSRLSKHRANHSRSMTEVALLLAKAHHVDLKQAYLAGMLHDICKEMPEKEARECMQIVYPQHLDEHHKVWHQWLAEDYLRHHLQIHNQKVLSAIAHHVKGDGKSALAKIIYISDKIDPARGYDITVQLRVSLNDLDEGIKLIKQQQKHYLKIQEGIDV